MTWALMPTHTGAFTALPMARTTAMKVKPAPQALVM